MSGGCINMRIVRNYDIAPVRVRVACIWIKGELLSCIRVCLFFPFFPYLFSTWLLTVAGTTYKLVVIKVFDLLWFPVEARISRLANTVLLPLWSMNDDEARTTKWQCRDWTWGRHWNGRAERIDRGMHQLHFRMLIWKHIDSCLSVHSLDCKEKQTKKTSVDKIINYIFCCFSTTQVSIRTTLDKKIFHHAV